jgi:hypothetical protein
LPWRWLAATQSFEQNKTIQRFVKAFAIEKKMVFNVKKLFNIGVGLSYGERSDASRMSGRSSGFAPL